MREYGYNEIGSSLLITSTLPIPRTGNEDLLTVVVENTYNIEGDTALPTLAELLSRIEDLEYRIEREGDPEGLLLEEIAAVRERIEDDFA